MFGKYLNNDDQRVNSNIGTKYYNFLNRPYEQDNSFTAPNVLSYIMYLVRFPHWIFGQYWRRDWSVPTAAWLNCIDQVLKYIWRGDNTLEFQPISSSSPQLCSAWSRIFQLQKPTIGDIMKILCFQTTLWSHTSRSASGEERLAEVWRVAHPGCSAHPLPTTYLLPTHLSTYSNQLPTQHQLFSWFFATLPAAAAAAICKVLRNLATKFHWEHNWPLVRLHLANL